MPETICQRPGCGRTIPGRKRKDARWCSRSCESKARRSASRRAAFEAQNPGAAELLRAESESLVDLHQRARRPAHWRDVEAGRVDDDLAEFSDAYDMAHEHQDDDEDGGIVGGSHPGQHAGYNHDAVWAEQMAYADAVKQIQSRYDALLRPYRETMRRNIGVKPVAMARLEASRDAEIRDLTRAHQKAEAMARAAREAPQRAVQAAERQMEYAALNAFGRDLPGGSRGYHVEEFHGRATTDIAVW